MTQTIDVTGLSDEAIAALRRQVEGLRAPPAAPEPPPAAARKPFWTGPVPAPGTPEWLNWFHAWVASQPRKASDTIMDDSRESIYD